jgi:hypothetical protein
MAVATPEWLTQHGGRLLASRDGNSWLVFFGEQPQYLLMPVPARGQFSCRVSQTVNGQRLDGVGVYLTPEDAVRGGLEDLRRALGW